MSETAGETCANCGAALQDRYCARCGQSRDALLRPAFSLLGQVLSDAFDLDGRLWRTLRALYLKPGAVARDYIDGKRQSFTPPIRLYVLATLLFFAVVALANIRVVAVSLEELPPAAADGAAPNIAIGVSLFGIGDPPDPIDLTPEQREAVAQSTDGLGGFGDDIELRALTDPAGLERTAEAAASQALIAMVVFYALLNAVLHPKRRLVEHVVNAVYFHAGLYVLEALSLGVRAVLGQGAHPGAVVGVGAATALWFVFWVVGSERGFYQSSVIGVILRTPFILAGYLISLVVVSLGLIVFALL